ncbi:putative RNA recognition motif domain, nucleotide-binding alpha-beta plait domain superfamily [Helianthus debilis subsp. tardiflorus]
MTTKFFVTNLPERCSSAKVGDVFSAFGEVIGVYVARKRDKKGNKFCFVSFKGVREPKELENKLKGIKMGPVKLLVNVAKFAAENFGFSGQPSDGNVNAFFSSQGEAAKQFNVRDQRSYRDVLGKTKGQREPERVFGLGGFGGDGMHFKEKSVVVPDRTSAFKDWGGGGGVVVSRTANLETLVDLDKLFRIAKVEVVSFKYLGGLHILISFSDAFMANSFLSSKNIWGPWFSKLEVWGGQALPLERVAWLSLHGIPLHLLEPDVLVQVGELFGKVLHTPKSLYEDSDLSVFKIRLLVREAQRIREVVSLKWKDRTFRIWVEEDQDVWVPDCLNGEVPVSLTSGSPMASSLVVNVSSSEFGAGVQSQKLNGVEEGEVLPINIEESYVGVIPMQKEAVGINDKVIESHGESENVGAQDFEGDMPALGVDVGPNRVFNPLTGRDLFNKVWEFGGADNFSFNNGVGPSCLKPVGPPKRTRSHKKKTGINGLAHDNSGAKSGEPVAKKRRRSKDQWYFPLGNSDKSGAMDKEALFSRNDVLEKSLDLNMDTQAESVAPPVIRWLISAVILFPWRI